LENVSVNKSVLATLITISVLLLIASSIQFVSAPVGSANLDQLRNGAANSPENPGNWVNGNIGSQTGHYVEGYSIPYRCVMTDLPTGTPITLVLGYDIKHSDKHAIDYLTYYDRIDDPSHAAVFGHPPENVNPLAGVTGVSATVGTYTIPAPSSAGSPVAGQPTQSYNSLVASEGISSVQMTLFGGTITNIAYVTQGDLTASQAETQIAVTFTVGNSTAVLAWGGHIGSRLDWGYDNAGVPNSAGGISGSPYHMRLKSWSSPGADLKNLGNQDRSLSAVAVYAPKTPTVTTILSNSTITLGNSVTDNVIVTGDNVIVPTGTVTFQVKFDNLLWENFDTKSLSSGTATSIEYFPLHAGQYWFRAIYPGDDNYLGSQSADNAEPLMVNKAPTTTTTLLSDDNITLGENVTDTVTVTGLPSPYAMPTGTVTFQVKFDAGSWENYDTKSLSSGTATSIEYVPLAAGQYWFRAIYPGDDNYLGSQSADNAEPLIVKQLQQITRTQGFWATHVAYTESVWENVDNKIIGTHNINDNGKLFGAFWSGISKKSNRDDRDNLDQARMQLLQQLVAAILNVTAFGDGSGTGTGLIAAGRAAFLGDNSETIIMVKSQLDNFNNSGDNLALPPGTNPGSANPRLARSIANKIFWDILP